MAFVMKGGRSRVPLTFFSKMFFCKNFLESFPDRVGIEVSEFKGHLQTWQAWSKLG